MEPHEHIEQLDLKAQKKQKHGSTALVFNASIVALLLVIVYFSYGYITRDHPALTQEVQQPQIQKVIQLDVLNGSRVKGAASRVTNCLRTGGFDVVEMKNYKTNNVHQTVVIDRVGDLSSARRVARALGVSEKNIVQQLNPDYFVDVSVIVGEDVASLKLFP